MRTNEFQLFTAQICFFKQFPIADHSIDKGKSVIRLRMPEMHNLHRFDFGLFRSKE